MCKANFAYDVKVMTPHNHSLRPWPGEKSSPTCSHSYQERRQREVDSQEYAAYLCLHISGAAHGEGKTTRPEKGSTRARWRAQSSPRSRPRRSVRRQSILRPERLAPGPLRDGKAPQGGWPQHQRRRRELWGLTTDLLQIPERARNCRAFGSAAQAARAKGRTQNLCRSPCLHRRTQGRQARSDGAAMSRRDRNTFRLQAAPAQPGTRARGQKKTPQSSNLTPPPADAAIAYEELRAAVLSAQQSSCFGLGVIRRRGLAAWIRDLGSEPLAKPPGFDHRPPDHGIAQVPTPASDELTRLIAGIVITLTAETAHA